MMKLLPFFLAFALLVLPLESQVGLRNPAFVALLRPAAAAVIPVSFVDTFNRADANPMSTTASGGGTWTSGPGALLDCKIVGFDLLGTGAENGCRILSPEFPDNQLADFPVGDPTQQCGPMVRMQSASDASGYWARLDDATHVSIVRVTDTGTLAYTLLGAQITVATVIASDNLQLSVSGTTITAYINDVVIGTRTDATYATGQPGLLINGTTGYLPNFTADNL